MNLSDAIEQAMGTNTWPTVHRAADGQGVLVVLRQDGQAVGFHLTQAGAHAGEWRMVGFTMHALDPASAMTSRTIRALPIGELLAEARRVAGSVPDRKGQEAPARFVRPSEVALAPFLKDQRGKSERSDRDYAGLALEYALLLEDGERSPIKRLVERFGGVPGTWANRLAEARRRGLLTPVKPGEAGGGLTDKAHALLWPEDEDAARD